MRMATKRIFFAFMLIVILLSIGTLFYKHAEGWSYVDSFYFSTMTLTTIGYGDIAPTSDGAKIFTSIYAIFGIGIMLYILSFVIGLLVFRQEGRVSRAFSYIGRMRRHEKKIDELEREQERELRELKKSVTPSLKKVIEHERELTEIEKRLDKRPRIRKLVRKHHKEIEVLKRKIKKQSQD